MKNVNKIISLATSNKITPNVGVDFTSNKIYASNGALYLEAICPFDMKGKGETFLPAKAMGAVAKMRNVKSFSLTKTGVSVKGDLGTTKLNLTDKPVPKRAVGEEVAKMPFEALQTVLKGAVDTTEEGSVSSTALTSGVFVSVKDGLLKAISTDGKRMSRVQMKNEELKDCDVLTFPVAFAQLLTSLNGIGEAVLSRTKEGVLCVTCENVMASCAKQDIEAKALKNVISSMDSLVDKANIRLSIDGEELLEAVQSVMNFDGKMVILSEKDKMLKVSSDSQLSEIDLNVNISTRKGDKEVPKVAYSAEYLARTLKNVLALQEGGDVILRLSEYYKNSFVANFETVTGGDVKGEYLVLPINTK
ncbi:hypothetical protein [Eubacterium oxidoreducens]|uniref:DNA polymerase III sliding clamp (Beta) subunit, PCNA homolog n=1 Tax=Eubacterium oxidoreducens TaxID=1732 RepID=A0A1G6C3T2_EUBOX|nr:hypothetical protein [Eubacterium oxidoreducens]SDB27529.1 DNA polymerase III sliding clamp (beta) subunit, PCNA homolog [Eubacterium oxidoreducens]